MFKIENATVDIYSWSRHISSVAAKISDQSIETLKALGRGKMICNGESMILRYDLADGLTIYLDTEE
jgi:hypothetical protein